MRFLCLGLAGFVFGTTALVHAADPASAAGGAGAESEAVEEALHDAGVTPERHLESQRAAAAEVVRLLEAASSDIRQGIEGSDAPSVGRTERELEQRVQERARKVRLADAVAEKLAEAKAVRDRLEAPSGNEPADDAPPIGKTVTVEVAIVEFSGVEPTPPAEAATHGLTLDRIRELAKAGKPAAVTRVRLATLEEQTASAQQADDLPVPSGQAFGGPGQPRPQAVYERHQFGTTVKVIPRVEEDGGIVMVLDVERNRLGRAAEGGGESFVPPPVETLAANVTLRVPNGETVIAHSSETPATGGSIVRAILVTAATDGGRDQATGEEAVRTDR